MEKTEARLTSLIGKVIFCLDVQGFLTIEALRFIELYTANDFSRPSFPGAHRAPSICRFKSPFIFQKFSWIISLNMILPCFIVLVLVFWDKSCMFAIVFLTCQFLSTILTVLISFHFVFLYRCNISRSVPVADSNLCVASNIVVLSVTVLPFNSTSCLSSASSCFISFCYLPVCPWRWPIPSYSPALNLSSMVPNAYYVCLLMWHVWLQSSCVCYKLFLVTILRLSFVPIFLFLFFLQFHCIDPVLVPFWLWAISERGKFLLNQLFAGSWCGGEVRATNQASKNFPCDAAWFTRGGSFVFSSFEPTKSGSLRAVQHASFLPLS